MKSAMIALLCAGLLLAGSARADLDEGTYAPDIEAKEWLNTEESGPISLAELRGMIVVLYFWVSYHAGGEYLMPLINQVENHPNLGRRRGVFLMGVTEADRVRVQDMIKEERIFFPIALESKAAEEYRITSFPRAVVIDPNGKIAYSGWPGREGGSEFVRKILDVAAETPPTRTHPREAAEAERFLDVARKEIRAGDYKAAFQAARSAYERALTGDPLKMRCQEMLDLIEALGRNRLAEGLQLVGEKKFTEGLAALREVLWMFRGTTVGKVAVKRLKELEERFPEVRRVLETLGREATARGLLASAKDALWDRSFGEAYDALQKIIKEYGETEVVADARTILQRMEKNQTIWGYVRDHQGEKDCTNWLGQARSFRQQGNFPKARELYRKVIETYPDTTWSEQAYRELGELP